MEQTTGHIRHEWMLDFFTEKEFWLLSLLVLAYFFRPLFGGETFFFRDIGAYSFADKQFWFNSLISGEIPFWNPYQFGGEPYFNNMFTSSLYPLNLIFFLLPFIQAFNWFIVLHFLLAANGAYFCARVIGLKPVSSVIVGVIYTFSGGMLSLANLPGLHSDMSYLPIMLAFWHLFLQQRRRRWFLLCVISGVFQALTWSHEGNEITMALLLVWTLCHSYPQTSRYRKMAFLGVLIVCIIGICAILIIPGIEIFRQAGRQYIFGYENFAYHSLHPKRIFELVFPWFLGFFDKATMSTDYWGASLSMNEIPFILNVYLGGGAILFAILGGMERSETNVRFSPLARRVYLLIACVFLIGSLGRFLPFFHVLYLHLPFIDLFLHSPIKLIIGMLFPVALLAGYASERYFSEVGMSQAFRQRVAAITWGIAGMFLLFAGGYWALGRFAERWMGRFFKIADTTAMQDGLPRSFFWAATMMLLIALLLQFRQSRYHRWQQPLFASILLLDLWGAGHGINLYAPQDFFTKDPDILPIVRQEINDGYLFRDKPKQPLSFNFPTNDYMWGMRWNVETFAWHTGFLYGIPVIFNEDPSGLGQKHIMMLWLKHEKNPQGKISLEQKLPLLSTAAVTLIITSEELSLPGVERIAEIPNDSNARFFLYRNRNAIRRVEFVTNVKEFSLQEEFFNEKILEMIMSSAFDPRKQVILFKEDIAPAQLFLQTASPETLPQIASTTPSPYIHKREKSLNSATYDVSVAQPGYLVFTEPFYPGWEATVDGKPAPQLRANLAFTAIPLPAGEHVVRRVYCPKLFYYGMLISFVFCGLTVILTHKRFGIIA